MNAKTPTLIMALMLAAALTLAAVGCQITSTGQTPAAQPTPTKHLVTDAPEYHSSNYYILDHRLGDGEEILRAKLEDLQERGYDTAELGRGAPPGHIRFILWDTH